MLRLVTNATRLSGFASPKFGKFLRIHSDQYVRCAHSVDVEAQQITSEIVANVSDKPKQSTDYEVVPDERRRAIRVNVQEFLNTFHLLSIPEGIKQASSLSNRPAMPTQDQIALANQTLKFYAEKEGALFDHLKELSHINPLLSTAQKHAAGALEAYTVRLMQEFAKRDPDTLTSTDTNTLLRVMTYNDTPSAAILHSLPLVQSVVIRELPHIRTVTVLLRLLDIVGHRTHMEGDSANPELVRHVLKQLKRTVGIQLPPKSMAGADVVFSGADILQRAAHYDAGLLDGYASLLHGILKCDGMRRVTQATHSAYMLSFYSYRNEMLFRHIRKAVDNRRRTELRANSLSVYVRLNWAYHAHGMEPPLSSLKAMTIFFERYPYTYNASVARELALLLPLIEVSKTPLRNELLANAMPVGGRLSDVLSSVQSACGDVAVNVWLDGGVVSIAGLVSPSNADIAPWPASLQPAQVTKENAGQLAGTPVAMILVEGQHCLLEPRRKFSGVVDMQRELLIGRGWRVVLARLSDMSQSAHPGEECLALMKRAAKNHRL